MTEPLTLAPATFVTPTPAGAYHVVTSALDGPAEHLIRAVLRSGVPVQIQDQDAASWTGAATTAAAIDAIAAAQDAGWIEGRSEPPAIPDAPLGEVLPTLLAPLSDIGHAALVDDQGFGLASVGFDPDEETELSAMSAEIARLRQRRSTTGLFAEAAQGWAVVDRHGAGVINFYPLAAGTQHFVLIVGGLPHLNHPSFVTLVWALCMRYDETADANRTAADPATVTTGGSAHA